MNIHFNIVRSESPTAPASEIDEHHMERYGEHARRLQTWIGGYGVGLAGLLVVQMRTSLSELRQVDPDLDDDALIVAQQYIESTAIAMRHALANAYVCIGVTLFLQVGLLLLNKMTQLELAHAAGDPPRLWRSFSNVVSDSAWIDGVVDSLSILFLAIATYIGLTQIVLGH